jgi:hypothetical protein
LYWSGGSPRKASGNREIIKEALRASLRALCLPAGCGMTLDDLIDFLTGGWDAAKVITAIAGMITILGGEYGPYWRSTTAIGACTSLSKPPGMNSVFLTEFELTVGRHVYEVTL